MRLIFRKGERPCLVSLHKTGEVIEVVPTQLDKVGLDPFNKMRAWEQRLAKEEEIMQNRVKIKGFSSVQSSPFAVTVNTEKKDL